MNHWSASNGRWKQVTKGLKLVPTELPDFRSVILCYISTRAVSSHVMTLHIL